MLAQVQTAALSGLDALPVAVEVDVAFGLPVFALVGLPDASVRESRDRVRAAIRNSGYEFPAHRITVNLAPADVRKAGTAFDLPIAVAVLGAIGIVPRLEGRQLAVIGELSLDGAVLPARGVLPLAAGLRRHGIDTLMLPAANVAEAAVVHGLRIVAVRTLSEAAERLNQSPHEWPPTVVPRRPPEQDPTEAGIDLADLKGQAAARRALEVAAAGGHHLLLVGPPGTGKTMLARRLPGILPGLTFEESLEVTAVHSVAGLVSEGTSLVTHRPFRAPHHTCSDAALVGGGSTPRPGEISLAHHGVLFMDELPEFSRRALEVLRQPLEEGRVRIARATATATFPSRFTLIGAMNPCPCGFHGHPTRPCRCTAHHVEHYHDRVSGPLRDRIDMTVELPSVSFETLAGPRAEESSAIVRARVQAARHRQAARAPATGVELNARLAPRALDAVVALDGSGRQCVLEAARRGALSARAIHRLLRVARTVADLEGSGPVRAEHVAEAVQYRQPLTVSR